MNKRIDVLLTLFVALLLFLSLLVFFSQENLVSLPILILSVPTLFVSFLIFARSKIPLLYLSVLLTFSPHRVTLYILRADAYATRKRDERAHQDFQRAIELEPNRAEIYIYRGRVSMNRQQYQQAMQDFNHALELRPDSHVAYNNRGWAYFTLKDYEHALQDYNQSIRLFDDYFLSHRGRGQTAYRLGKWAEAVADFEQALRLSSKISERVDMYGMLGFTYHTMGEYRQAIENYQYALTLAPQQAGIYNNLAFSYVFLKEYQLAIQACNQAIKLNPKSDPAYNNRGKAYLGLGNLPQAQADFAHAVELDPPFVTHTWYLTWVNLCQKPADEEVATHLEKIAAHNDENSQTDNCQGVASWIRGANGIALQQFAQSIQKKPNQWDAYFWMGLVHASMGHDQQAREAIQTALEKNMPPILLSPLRWVHPALHQELALP